MSSSREGSYKRGSLARRLSGSYSAKQVVQSACALATTACAIQLEALTKAKQMWLLKFGLSNTVSSVNKSPFFTHRTASGILLQQQKTGKDKPDKKVGIDTEKGFTML